MAVRSNKHKELKYMSEPEVLSFLCLFKNPLQLIPSSSKMFTLGLKDKRGDTMILRTSLLFLAFMAATSLASNEKQTYIIHMDQAKIATTTDSLGNVKKWYESVIDTITKLSPQQEEDQGNEKETSFPQLLYVYETAISGFAATLSGNQLDSLRKIDGFLSATPDEILGLHTTHTPQFLGLKNGGGLWSSAAQNSVSNVVIGVLDTGIWPEHASFQDLANTPPVPSHWKGGCDMEGTQFSSSNCNKKLIGARAFFKGYEAIGVKINETVEYRSPRDSDGHGTHTAATAAGNVITRASMFGLAKGKASGMSYAARIAAYKVCWQYGCASSDILAAIDQAVADGVDVLSLSIGGSSKPFYSDSVAIASFGAIQKGVFVSCSAGNSGPLSSTVANTAPWIMTVAASYIERSFPTSVKLGNGETFIGASLYSGKSKTKKLLPLVYGVKAGGKGAELCIKGSLSPELVKGKIVVCDRGIIGRAEKGEKVKMAGGAGMLLLNTEDEGEELLAVAHLLPATSLGAVAGKAIKNYLSSAGKKARASIVFNGTKYGDPAPVMAAFSSRGPSSIEPTVIKPDVTAPGVNILAAWPPKTSPTQLKTDNRSVIFNIISGTSMSCPHVSGLAALLKSVHKNWSPAAIKSALMTTAYTLVKKNAPISDASSTKSANSFAFGSGHVDPEKASDPGLIYDLTGEDYLNYLCSLDYTPFQISLLSRRKFNCPNKSVIQPGDLNYPSFAVLFKAGARNATLTYKRTVTNVGGAKDTYTVQISMPDEISVTVEPKVLKFTKVSEKLSYKVSFLALKSGKSSSGSNSFGKLTWISSKYRVTSPIAVTWL